MTRRNHKPYVVTDIEPVIAMVDAARWERDRIRRPPHRTSPVVDKFAEARLLRSIYQRELMRRLAASAIALLMSLRVRPAFAKTRMER